MLRLHPSFTCKTVARQDVSMARGGMCGQRSEQPKTTREKRLGLCMHSQSRLDELKSTSRRRWLSFETGPRKVRRPICR